MLWTEKPMLSRRSILAALGASALPAIAMADPPLRKNRWKPISEKRTTDLQIYSVHVAEATMVLGNSTRGPFDIVGVVLKPDLITFSSVVAGSWRDDDRSLGGIEVLFTAKTEVTEDTKVEVIADGKSYLLPAEGERARVKRFEVGLGVWNYDWSADITREEFMEFIKASRVAIRTPDKAFCITKEAHELLRELYFWS